MHPPCQCDGPTGECPRYGWMKGARWGHCQGRNLSEQQRQALLNIYLAKRDEPRPTLIAKAVSFAKALFLHAASGFERADDETIAARLQRCNEPCDSLLDGECTECGCPVEVKATWASQWCPLRRWPNDPERPKGGGCCGGSKG